MKQISSVIEIGTSKIVCAITEVKDFNDFEIVGLASVPFDGVRKGNFVNPARLVDSILEAVEEAENQAGKKIKSVFVGIPGCFVKVACNGATVETQSDDLIISEADIEFLAGEAQKFFVPEKMEILHKSPIGFKLDGGQKVISPVGMRSRELSGVFSFATCEKDLIGFLVDVFHQLKIEVVDFVAVSLTQGLMVTPADDKLVLSIIVDVGYYDTDIVVMQGDGILYHSTLNVGGFNFTNDLCIILGLSLNDAEQIKRRYVFGLDTSYIAADDLMRDDSGRLRTHSHASVQAIIESRAQELLYLIDKRISTLGLQFSRETKMYITGGGVTMMRGCREMFDNYFQFDVKTPQFETPKINTPNLFSTLSMIDFAGKHEATVDMTVSNKKRSHFVQKIIDFFTE